MSKKAKDDSLKEAMLEVNASNTVLWEMIEHNKNVLGSKIVDLEQEIAILRDELKSLKMDFNVHKCDKMKEAKGND